MSKVLSFDYPSANSFVVNYLVDSEEFNKIKEDSVTEAIKDVEVEGFRKGKAPRDVALAKVEPARLENIILTKVFQANEKTAVDAGLTELNAKGRHHTGINVNFADGATKELEDGSFQFQLIFNLLPQIDTSKVSTIKLRDISADEIPGRPNLKDFLKQEKDRIFCNYNRFEESDKPSETFHQVIVDLVGMDGKKVGFEEKGTKVLLGLGLFIPEIEKQLVGTKKGDKKEFNVDFPAHYPNADLAGKKIKISADVKSVLAPQYTTIDEVFEKSKQSTQLKQQFGEVTNLETVLTNVYNQETAQRIQNIKQREIVNEVMKVVPDFDSNEELISSEITRIFENISKHAEEHKHSLGEALVEAFPTTQTKDPVKMTEKEVRAELERQVREEFKWANILSYIYQVEVQDKPTTADFNQVKEAAQKDPERYGFSKDTPKEQIENAIIDRVVRQVAFTWLSNLIDGKQTDTEVTDVKSKPAKAAAKKPAVKAKAAPKKK